MTPPLITHVRHDAAAARELLQDFIFGGMFGIGRVPRGIEPALVAEFIENQGSRRTRRRTPSARRWTRCVSTKAGARCRGCRRR